MLYQELPPLESSPLDGWSRWLAPAMAFAAGATGAVILLLVGIPVAAAVALIAGVGAAIFMAVRRPAAAAPKDLVVGGPDFALIGTALGLTGDPVALTDSSGSLLL